jgi:hypothetical protein
MIRDTWKILILVVLVMVIIGAIIAFISFNNSNDKEILSNTPPQIVMPITNFSELMKELPKDVIINLTLIKDDSGPPFIKGNLFNNGTKTISYYQLNIGGFNATGNGVLQIHLSGENMTPGDGKDISIKVPSIPGETIESIKVLSLEIQDVTPVPSGVPTHYQRG